MIRIAHLATFVPAAVFALALALGLGVIANAAGTVPNETIVHAIGIIEWQADQTDYTKSGKPRVASIERVLGVDISAAERDAAWDAYRIPVPTPDVGETAELEAEIAALTLDLDAAMGRAATAEGALNAVRAEAERQIDDALREGLDLEKRYKVLLDDAEDDRRTAAIALETAAAVLAEAEARERGAGPSAGRECRTALNLHVLDVEPGWFSDSVEVSPNARDILEQACFDE